MTSRHSIPRIAATVGAAALLVVSCGSTTSVDSAAAPEIADLEVVVRAAEATLIADVTDADGDLDVVLIDWGDGRDDTIGSGFPGLRVDHEYTEAGRYTVIVEALDDAGHRALQTIQVEIGDVDEAATASTMPESSTAPETTATDATDPAAPRPPRTAPPTTAPPRPAPVEIDLLDDGLVFAGSATEETVCCNADVGSSDDDRMLLWAEHYIGTNQRAAAEASLTRRFDTNAMFGDPRVTGIEVEIEYAARAVGLLRGPAGREAQFVLTAALDEETPTELMNVTRTSATLGDDPFQSIDEPFEQQRLTAVIERGATFEFVLHAVCVVMSGGAIATIYERGQCDFLSDPSYGVGLTALKATLTPILG